jgi:LacI family transcriptional regulator
VAFGRTLGDSDFTWVDVDGAAGVCAGVEHLLQLGHHRIAFLGTHRDYSFSHFRFEGYLEALLAAGVPYDDDLVAQDLVVGSNLDDLIDRLLALPVPPTALLACADFLASGVLRVLRERGLAVPDHLSLVAFDDTLITQHAEPPLTSIRQDNQAIGAHVAQLLIQQLQAPSAPPQHLLLTPTLIYRRSTAPLECP